MFAHWPFARRTYGARTTHQANGQHHAQSRRYDHPFAQQEAARDANFKQEMGTLFTLPIDLAISLLFGSSVTMFLIDKEKILNDFGRLPLVHGKSFASEELCAPFSREFEKYPRDFWTEGNAGDFKSLLTIRDFVHNCHRRNEVEKEIRPKNGAIDDGWMDDNGDESSQTSDGAMDYGAESDEEPVDIPEPGISR